MNDKLQFTAWLILSRIFQFFLVFITPNKQFDKSTTLFLENFNSLSNSYWDINLWNKLLSWDSIYFMENAWNKGIPTFEHQIAFSPNYSYIINLITHFFINNDKINIYSYLKIAIIFNNILIILSGLILINLSKKIFPSSNRNFIKIVCLLFCFNTCAGFLIAPYSEPLSMFLSFLAMNFREKSLNYYSKDKKNKTLKFIYYYILTAILISLSICIRSNCILLGFFLIYDFLKILLFSNASKKTHRLFSIIPLLSGLLLLITFIIQFYYLPFKRYCPQSGNWCLNPLFNNYPILNFLTKKNLYNYIQEKRWNVGFLSYWTINNLPNFLISLPISITLINYCKFFINKRIHLPYIIITILFLFVMFFFANVQIINRISIFLPVQYWIIASLLINNNNRNKFWPKLYLIYCIIWFHLQTILFANFLPPA